MNKWTLIFLFCLPSFCAWAQETITVVDNQKVSYEESRGSFRWYMPLFSHEGSQLRSDSADYNQGDNFFDAYGHVVITQPDGTLVYADKLHYTEATRQALLTGNVRLVDGDAVLSTDYLTYNLKTKIGNYHGGGRIVNQGDTLTSLHGYYFENTKDAYFRKNVVVQTQDATIYTDSMRYNSESKMTYFYGPTNIQGENGNLYTENGDYNTQTKYARFGKNNLYTEGSKFLRGDSLLYDGQTGNGRAIKNVIFVDTAEHLVLRGQLGEYNKLKDRIVMTDRAYIVLATENGATDKADSTTKADSTITAESDTQPTDSLHQDAVVVKDSVRTDSTYMTADTLISQVILLKDYPFANLKMDRSGGPIDTEEGTDVLEGFEDFQFGPADSTEKPVVDTANAEAPADSIAKLNPDSLNSTDTLISQPPVATSSPPDSSVVRGDADTSRLSEIIPAPLDTIQSLRSDSASESLAPADTISIPDSIPEPPPADFNYAVIDSMGIQDSIPQAGQADSTLSNATAIAFSESTTKDSLISDTSTTRIVIAYHDVKIFKSDLQAIADSAYYGYADSVIRCIGTPMIWSQGSQMTGDTVFLQLKNQKLDNMLLKGNAFVVNTELDSSRFNQVKGRQISGFFKDGQLDVVYVDGNAESIYHSVEEGQFTGMGRTLSGRIKLLFQDNHMSDVIWIKSFESTYYPIDQAPEDRSFLEGFIWKPELRPKSKEEILPGSESKPLADSIPDTDSTGRASQEPLPPAQESSEKPEPKSPEALPASKLQGIRKEAQEEAVEEPSKN